MTLKNRGYVWITLKCQIPNTFEISQNIAITPPGVTILVIFSSTFFHNKSTNPSNKNDLYFRWRRQGTLYTWWPGVCRTGTKTTRSMWQGSPQNWWRRLPVSPTPCQGTTYSSGPVSVPQYTLQNLTNHNHFFASLRLQLKFKTNRLTDSQYKFL